jgi:hypothetical protein
MLFTPRPLQLNADATSVVHDYLNRDPASAYLITEPLGSDQSFILAICEKEPEKWHVFRETKLFESIRGVTDSTINAQELVS